MITGDVGKLHNFVVTCIPGFEAVVEDELRHLCPDISSVRPEKGRTSRLFFRLTQSPKPLQNLGSALGVEAILCQRQDITVGRPGLERVAAGLRHLDLEAAQRLVRVFQPDADVKRYRLATTLIGSHRFSRGELRAEARRVLDGNLQTAGSGPCLSLRLQVRKKRALLTVALRPAGRVPGAVEREGVSGALAFCIFSMLELTEEDVVLVPGGGAYSAKELPRSGSEATVISMPQQRPAASNREEVVVGCSNHLPFRQGCITAAIAVVGARQGIAAVALTDLTEFVRILAAGGLLVCLTPVPKSFAGQLRALEMPMEIVASLPLQLRGRRWAMFVLERLELLSQPQLQ